MTALSYKNQSFTFTGPSSITVDYFTTLPNNEKGITQEKLCFNDDKTLSYCHLHSYTRNNGKVAPYLFQNATGDREFPLQFNDDTGWIERCKHLKISYFLSDGTKVTTSYTYCRFHYKNGRPDVMTFDSIQERVPNSHVKSDELTALLSEEHSFFMNSQNHALVDPKKTAE